jgi:hypothetical protein
MISRLAHDETLRAANTARPRHRLSVETGSARRIRILAYG